jgi:hypothetical protein
MTERERRPTTDNRLGPAGLGDPFGGDAPAGAATVTHGPYAESLPVAGMTVQAVRERYQDRFDIGPNSQAILDGDPVDENTQIGVGQTLSFVMRAGEKGGPGRARCPT